MTKIQKESNSQHTALGARIDKTVVTYDKDTKRKQFTTDSAVKPDPDLLL